MLETLHAYFQELIKDLLNSDVTFFWLVTILTSLVIVLDALSAMADKKKKAAGVKPEFGLILTPSVDKLEAKEYTSDIQLISGKPDALLKEHGKIIPVLRKPTSNKVRDRYIAQLLIYMRLIEEFEGVKPPYGYLILGKNARQVKILNTAQRQSWLDEKLKEMQAILSKEADAKAEPQIKKCKSCFVSEQCEFSIK